MANTQQFQVQGISHVTVLVSDEDRALKWYRQLGCEVQEDQPFEFEGQPSRWLTVSFPGQDLRIVLMRPMPSPGKAEPDPPGNGTMTVLAVADCSAAINHLESLGVDVVSPPEEMPWGVSAIIRDPDGNPFNLVQAR